MVLPVLLGRIAVISVFGIRAEWMNAKIRHSVRNILKL